MAKTFEEQVLAKLDYLLRVHTIRVTKVMKQNEQTALLNRAGLPPQQIADWLGTTGNTVNVALTNLRKSGQKKGKKGR